MIIGNGLIANTFRDYDRQDVIFFASGVSNSLETRRAEFEREENLVTQTFRNHPDKIFIYFSTCSIYDSSKTGSDYVMHKLRMEQLIKKHCKTYLILRVSNAIGKGGNPNLLINYLVRSVKNNATIDVHTKATRNFIDTEDIRKITLELIRNNQINKVINIAYLYNYSMIELLEILERFYNTKLNLNLIKSGSGYDINILEIEDYFRVNGLTNKESYLCKMLEKYYS